MKISKCACTYALKRQEIWSYTLQYSLKKMTRNDYYLVYLMGRSSVTPRNNKSLLKENIFVLLCIIYQSLSFFMIKIYFDFVLRLDVSTCCQTVNFRSLPTFYLRNQPYDAFLPVENSNPLLLFKFRHNFLKKKPIILERNIYITSRR